MEYYKEINRDLILLNQELKLQNSAYRKELVSLRTQLLEEHEMRVIAQKKFKMILIENFKNALSEVEPESCLLKMLYDRDTGGGRYQKGIEKNKILEELRSSLALERRSSVTISPTRRSSLRTPSITSPESSNESVNSVQDKEESTTTLDRKGDKAREEMYLEDTVVSNTRALDCINEGEVEEEEEEQEEEEVEDSEDPYDVDDSENLEESDNESFKKNITDVLLNSSPESSLTRVPIRRMHSTKHSRSPLQNLSNFNNLTEESPTLVIKSNIVVRRDKRKSSKNSSIEVARHMRSPKQDSFLNDELYVANTTSLLEHCGRVDSLTDISTTTIAFNELSLKQFSSTPNNTQLTSPCDESLVRTRLRRTCKPKNLAEPSLRDKLRNENVSKRNSQKKK